MLEFVGNPAPEKLCVAPEANQGSKGCGRRSARSSVPARFPGPGSGLSGSGEDFPLFSVSKAKQNVFDMF